MNVSPGKGLLVGLLGILPLSAGFAVNNAVKEKGVSNLGSGLIAGGAAGLMGIGVGVASYYILGLDQGNGTGYVAVSEGLNGMGIVSAERMGLLDATKATIGAMVLNNCGPSGNCKVY